MIERMKVDIASAKEQDVVCESDVTFCHSAVVLPDAKNQRCFAGIEAKRHDKCVNNFREVIIKVLIEMVWSRQV